MGFTLFANAQYTGKDNGLLSTKDLNSALPPLNLRLI
jgi:hypothetical protein